MSYTPGKLVPELFNEAVRLVNASEYTFRIDQDTEVDIPDAYGALEQVAQLADMTRAAHAPCSPGEHPDIAAGSEELYDGAFTYMSIVANGVKFALLDYRYNNAYSMQLAVMRKHRRPFTPSISYIATNVHLPEAPAARRYLPQSSRLEPSRERRLLAEMVEGRRQLQSTNPDLNRPGIWRASRLATKFGLGDRRQ